MTTSNINLIFEDRTGDVGQRCPSSCVAINVNQAFRMWFFDCKHRGDSNGRLVTKLCMTGLLEMCESREQTSYEILSYLKDHPDAQDTLEGVVEWWVFQQKLETRALQVQSVLGELVNRGLVMERKGKDQRSHYRINRRRLREIRSLLEQRPAGLFPDCPADKSKHS